MPLSDRERKQLEELESGLAAEDPRLAQRLASGALELRFRHGILLGAGAAVLGIVLLIVGVGIQSIVVGIAGFLLMGSGTYLLLEGHPWRLQRSRRVK